MADEFYTSGNPWYTRNKRAAPRDGTKRAVILTKLRNGGITSRQAVEMKLASTAAVFWKEVERLTDDYGYDIRRFPDGKCMVIGRLTDAGYVDYAAPKAQ